MTDREKAIVMAYTGICMLTKDKWSVFHEYVESIMGRPVYTHEMETKAVYDLIKEKARPDFIALCSDESYPDVILNKWIGAEVLDRIRNELHATAEKHEDGIYYLRDEWIDEIFDKYK